jgi:UDP-N-acetyl-D-mannosaminuronate dehydrogenase
VKQTSKVAVVGLGEVGKPLYELMSEYHHTIGVDIAPIQQLEPVHFLHICYPFEISDFVGETARYIETFKPTLTIINSTVGIGTTRRISERTGAAVINSPIRGKHARMLEELRMYTKYIGALDQDAGELGASHFQSVGLITRVLSSPEATELAKLTETTYFGLLIAWAQEVDRYCDVTGANFDDVVSFYEEINYLPPVKYWPGIIGGHCVMPNIEILLKYEPSRILEAIKTCNTMKVNRDAHKLVAVASASRGLDAPQLEPSQAS